MRVDTGDTEFRPSKNQTDRVVRGGTYGGDNGRRRPSHGVIPLDWIHPWAPAICATTADGCVTVAVTSHRPGHHLAPSPPTPNFLWKHPRKRMGVDGNKEYCRYRQTPSSLYLAIWSTKYRPDCLGWQLRRCQERRLFRELRSTGRLGMRENVYYRKIPSICV